MGSGERSYPIVLVTFPDYDPIGLTAAGLEVRIAPKHGPRTPAELSELLVGVSAAVVSTDPFTAEVLEHAVDLRIIARTGVGYDTIDIPAATRLGIQVVTTPGANEDSVADHALGLILAAVRRVPEFDRDTRGGGWHRTGVHTARQLAGSTVGLIGYGRIGRRVATRLRGFGVELLVHDPALTDDSDEPSIALDELLKRSEIVSLHVPLVPATRNLIDAAAIELMRPDAILVNTSRGGVVDERALYDALTSGRIASAAIDVFETEPPSGSPLLTLDNVVLSPHNGGISTTSIAEMARRTTAAVIDVLAGGVADDLVNPQAVARQHIRKGST